MRSVDSATVRGRRLSLPQEICPVSLRRLRMPRGILTAGQKSAEGVLGYVVGKASEALHDLMLTAVDSHRTPYGIGSAGLPRIQCRKQRPDRLVPRRRTSHPPSNKIDAPQKTCGAFARLSHIFFGFIEVIFIALFMCIEHP